MAIRIPLSRASSLLLIVILALGVGACEKVSHESIDKWGHTEKGPEKLLETLKGSDDSADLRAHAAQVLIEIERFPEVKEVLVPMEEKPRQKLMTPLATRLWEVARINDAMAIPTSRQSNAKDALFQIMEFADTNTQAQIGDYLVEWFVGGHYEGRARSGRVSGAAVMRKVGPAASKRLLQAARGILAKPPDENGKRDQVGDELLRALALCGDAEALGLLLDLVAEPRGDVGLPKRAMRALHFAFVEPLGFEPVDGKALLPIQARLEPMPYNRDLAGIVRNDSTALLAAIGAPECIPLFTKMVSYPTDVERYRWIGTQQGLRCAGVQGMEAITAALPSIPYDRGLLSKYVWDEVLKFEDTAKVIDAAIRMLSSQSPVSRITGLEVLGELGAKAATSENVKRIKALSGDTHQLVGWWGDQSETPKKERKTEPTIGDRASDVAKSLSALASGQASK